MTSSVIVKHYKKQLLYRQNEETYNSGSSSEEEKGSVRKKKKNKDHMELVTGSTEGNGVIQAPPRHLLPQMVTHRETRPHPYLPIRPIPRRRGEERAIDLRIEKDEPKTKARQLFLIKNLLNEVGEEETTRNRRQSVDTVSVSSSGSESVKSPKPAINKNQEIPQGKLCYVKEDHCFIRYFDDDQRKLFLDSISNDCHLNRNEEIVKIPRIESFSSKDNLTVEEYVHEMTLVETCAPCDFYHFYKFVTGYQICNNNLPVSFLTFLKIYNTNGLKELLDRYISNLKKNDV